MVVGFNGAGLAALAHFHSDGGAGTLSRWAHPKPHWLFAIVVGACLRADCQSGSVMGSGLDRVAPRTPSGLTHAGGQDECVAHFLWFWFGPDGERLARCTRRLFALDAHWPCPGSFTIPNPLSFPVNAFPRPRSRTQASPKANQRWNCRGVSDTSLECTFEMIDPENRPLYASDYSHRDFDLPSTIYDLPFLSEKAKHNMLGVRRLACSSCRRAMRSRERT